jgi:DNA-binding transcriptional ArsR family regulator
VLTEMSIAEGPLTPSEIAKRTRLATNQVTANITKLVDARLIVATGRPDKRRRYYEVSDRLFRTWIQMREDRSSRQRLRFLAEFYQLLYASRPQDAWGLALKVAWQYWNDLGRGSASAARTRLRTINHLIPALRVHDDPLFVFDRLDRPSDREPHELIDGLRRAFESCRDSETLPILACQIADLYDRLGSPEGALPYLEKAVKAAPHHRRCAAWWASLRVAMGGTAALDRLDGSLLISPRVDEPNEARPYMRLILSVLNDPNRITITDSLAGDAEFEILRALRDTDTAALADGLRRLDRRPYWIDWVFNFAEDDPAAAARAWLARGYEGEFFLWAMLPSPDTATRYPALLDVLGPHVTKRAKNVLAMFPRKDRMAAYRMLARWMPSPFPPYSSATWVESQPDRDAALAALHPEEREAVEILLGSTTKDDEPA